MTFKSSALLPSILDNRARCPILDSMAHRYLAPLLLLLAACSGSPEAAELDADPAQVTEQTPRQHPSDEPATPAAGGSATEVTPKVDPPSAGAPDVLPEGGAMAGGGQPSEPQAGAPAAGAGGSSPVGGSTAAGGSAPTCAPTPWLEACADRTCGAVPDGCGHTYQCGSCPGLSECNAAGACAPSCSSQGLECGAAPGGLDCGTCGDGLACDAGQCVEPCHEEPEDTTAGQCALAGQRIWLGCRFAPKPLCHQPSADVPSVWCCPE